jgi:uncharacterized protein YdhG (YjbR/CyaY superfamily)
VPKRPTTIDEYLATLRGPRRQLLDELRRTLRKLIPDAEECISYGLPAFRSHGSVIAGFQATAKGCSYYPFSGSTLATLARELADYSQTKSAVHFGPDEPLPTTLVKKLVKARLAEVKSR